jgi:mannose-6-phosphate isomerase-like protein (cupin superfamily)
MITEANPWEEKVWGLTRCLIQSPHFSLHELKVEAGGYCSFHYHQDRANRFVIKSGVVRVVWCHGWRLHCQRLAEGHSCIVHSLVPHQFQILESGDVFEEYFPDRGGVVHNHDIIRLTKGGITKSGFYDTHGNIGIMLEDGSLWDHSITQQSSV